MQNVDRHTPLAPSSMLAAGSSAQDASAAQTAPGSPGVAAGIVGEQAVDLPDLGPELPPTVAVHGGGSSRGGGTWTAAGGDGGRGGWRQA